MLEMIHEKVFRYIDRKTCYPLFDYDRWSQRQTSKFAWIHIHISDGFETNGRIRVSKEEKGKFCPKRMISIHRKDKSIPNISLMDEICTLLHEYGHYVSFHKGNADDKIQTTEVGSSYLIDFNLQKSLVYDEECNAWKHAFLTVWQLPVSKAFKFCLYPYMAFKAIVALHSYRMFAEGIVG